MSIGVCSPVVHGNLDFRMFEFGFDEEIAEERGNGVSRYGCSLDYTRFIRLHRTLHTYTYIL